MHKFLDVLKFLVFVLLLPVLVATTVAFCRQVNTMPEILASAFVMGIFVYFFVHVFIYEPQPVYQYGQKIVSDIFTFFAPLVKVASFFLPIYSIIALIVFFFVALVFKGQYANYCMFLVSFTLTMHFVFTAKALRDKDSNALKPTYLFSISVIYIANAFILALLFALILPKEFSFTDFFQTVVDIAGNAYRVAFAQLFL